MADFVEVAALDQLPPGKSTVVTVAGKHIVRNWRAGQTPISGTIARPTR